MYLERERAENARGTSKFNRSESKIGLPLQNLCRNE